MFKHKFEPFPQPSPFDEEHAVFQEAVQKVLDQAFCIAKENMKITINDPLPLNISLNHLTPGSYFMLSAFINNEAGGYSWPYRAVFVAGETNSSGRRVYLAGGGDSYDGNPPDCAFFPPEIEVVPLRLESAVFSKRPVEPK